MTVSKPIPCSLYDIQGLQSWLDEMALNGLFFHHLSHFNDQAYFETGEPRPVRYRLDPADKDSRKGKEREDAYAQMGWSYVSRIGKRFYIFSSDDPEAPELYNDSQSLAIAMEKLVNREVKSTIYCALAFVLLMLLLLFLGRRSFLSELLLWESPQDLAILGIAAASILIFIPMIFLQIRSQRRLIAALSQGFPPKAGRRWNRPRVLVWYIPFWFLLCVAPRLFVPDTRLQVTSLENAALSHPWPSLAYLEHADGYASTNDSWFAPVQEYVSAEDSSSGGRWTSVRYIRARSPELAELIFSLELEDAAKFVDRRSKWNGYSSSAMSPRDWPGVDRLETAQYTLRGQETWTFAALRGRDVLVVDCAGYPSWEEYLPQFLDVLDQYEEGSVT